MDGKSQPTTSELMIMIAGAVMLVGSFLDFAGDTNAWGRFLFPVATLLPLYGVIMAAQIAVAKFASVKLPNKVVGFTWEQVHLVLGLMAGLMSVAWLITDTGDKKIGEWLLVLGGIGLTFGAVMMQRERNTGAIG